MVEKLFPDPSLKNQNLGYFDLSLDLFNTVCFNYVPS